MSAVRQADRYLVFPAKRGGRGASSPAGKISRSRVL